LLIYIIVSSYLQKTILNFAGSSLPPPRQN
jgi:hypothetical protein